MRLLYVFLSLISVQTFAQVKSMEVVFMAKEIALQQKQALSQFVGTQHIEQVVITSFIAPEPSVSKNRITLEYQLLSLKKFLSELGIASNVIRVIPFQLADIGKMNKAQLQFSFKEQLSAKVLSKTKLIQVSENITPPRPQKKKKYQPKLLSYDQFKADQLVRIPNLIFKAGTTQWLHESQDALVELYNVLKYKPNLKVEFHGHVCCDWAVSGPPMMVEASCLDLSEGRAKAVYDFMVLNSIDKSRLSYKGFGAKKKLRDDRHNNEAAFLNRRVEVYVISE